MNSTLVKLLEQVVVAGMVVGTLGMFQPWSLDLYQYGFALLAFCTLAFIVVSHLPVQTQSAGN